MDDISIYSDGLSSYQGLDAEFARHETINHQAGEYVRGPATTNGIEGFWAYAKEHLLRHHGMGDEHFLLDLKEIEYHFNHRDLA